MKHRQSDLPDVLRRPVESALTPYCLSTNAGLKQVAASRHGVSYKELLHIRRRYVHKASMRDAIRRVVNAIMAVRAPDIWSEGTMACVSDSANVGDCDQNLVTEWHARYVHRQKSPR